MNAIAHFEVPHLALWKSCVAEVLAKARGLVNTTAYGIDTGDPLMTATDRYCTAMDAGRPLTDPGKTSNDKDAVESWLSYLHHKMAHARIAKKADAESTLKSQIAEYKFGNPLWQQMFIQYYKYYWQYPYHKGATPKYRSWQKEGGSHDPAKGNHDSSKGNYDSSKGNLDFGVIQWTLSPNARIAIVGDIGTGTDAAAAVLSAACKFKPEAILHLGDVYFSGTRPETNRRLVGLVRKVLKEEKCPIPFFTVPGNHEYFTGAVSYLDALDSGKLIAHKDQRQQASYFCLRSADNGWQFLGLDTGYNGHYMNVAKGALQSTLKYLHIGEIEKPKPGGDPYWPSAHNPYFLDPSKDPTSPVDMVTVRPDEALWHADKLSHFPGRSVLLSHHQLYSALDVCGIAQKPVAPAAPGNTPAPAAGGPPDPSDPNRIWVNTGLWQQFGPWFGDKVAAWLWGHEHNLLIFEDNYRPADWPTDAAFMNIYRNLPKGRCAGHSAIPVQDTEQPYKVNYPVPFKQDGLQLDLTKVDNENWYNHGFQIMELAGAGKPARLSYFQVSLENAVPLPLYIETIT